MTSRVTRSAGVTIDIVELPASRAPAYRDRAVSEPATKQDLDQTTDTLRSEMSATETRLRSDMSTMDVRVRTDIATVETRLRSDLNNDMKEMETKLRFKLRSDMAEMETRLGDKMNAMEKRLRTDIGKDMQAMEERLLEKFKESAKHVANTVAESHRKEVAAVDEKYQDLPEQHAALRADVDGHVADLRLHPQPPTISAKRLRRPRSR